MTTKNYNPRKDTRCGTCIGGVQEVFGVDDRCWACKGTGKCNHKWGTPIYKGEQWSHTGKYKTASRRETHCLNCAAYLNEELNPDGSNKYFQPTVKHPAWDD